MPDDQLPGSYRPIAEHLPGVYQGDAASFAQVRGYTQLVDALYRAYLAQLDDLTTWLSPDARDVWPPGLQPSAPMEAVYAAYGDVFNEVARWFAFRFPESWNLTDEEDELDRERHFLLRVPRFWRRRGTPRGFVAWFCFYFKLFTRPERPQLLEHFKYRPADDTSGTTAGDEDPYAHRVTLLVPRSGEFRTVSRRRISTFACAGWRRAIAWTWRTAMRCVRC